MYDKFQTDRLIDLWFTEDVGACDLTAQVMIEPDERGAFTTQNDIQHYTNRIKT